MKPSVVNKNILSTKTVDKSVYSMSKPFALKLFSCCLGFYQLGEPKAVCHFKYDIILVCKI